MDTSVPGFRIPPSSEVSGRTAWLDYVRPRVQPGLSTCVADGLLRLDGLRLAATWIDVVAMRLVEWAVFKRKTLVLISPDPYDLLVPLTAAAVHVWRMLELNKQFGGYPHTDAKVAVVTDRLRLRSAYRRLKLRDAALFDAVPAATRLPTGGVAVLGKADRRAAWGTLFVSRASELSDVRNLSLVVVDLPVYDWDQLEAIDVPKIIVGHDPSNHLVHRLARTLPVFAWDADDLRDLAEIRATDGIALEPVALRLEQLAVGTECAPVPVPSQKICVNAALFWNDVGLLHRAARTSFQARALTNEVHELFQDLLHLAVPTSFYEAQTGRSFQARLRDLHHKESEVRGDLRDLYLPTVHLELRDLAQSLGEHSPKETALDSVLREQVERRRDVMLVTRTAQLARMHGAHLASSPELRDVRVSSLGAVSEEKPAEVAVLTGLAPAWARHIYLTGIAREIRVLAYAAEQQLPVEEPFVEADYVRKTIAYQRKYTTWLARPAAKASCWEKLSGESIGVVDDSSAAPMVDPSDVAFVDLPKPPDVPPGLWDAGLPSLEERETDRYQPVDSFETERGGPVEGLRVTFEDGRWVVLDLAGSVTRFSSVQKRADPGSEVAQLEIGDDVVFLDGDARKDVLAKVLEVAKEIPHLATAATWVEYWRDGLRRGKQRFGTYNAFADELRARGCEKQPQTVRLWVIGHTIGPNDPLDVRRVGEALEDVALRDHHEIVYQGITAFRGAHAHLMQRVGALAIQVGAAATAGAIRADEVIDERSGITAADFQGCLEILRVRSLARVGVVPAAVVGRLHESREREMDQ